MMNGATTDRESAMNAGHFSSILAYAGLGLCLLAMPPASAAADNFTAVTATDKPAKTKKPKAAKPPANPGTGESKAERDKRLLRECRGKANAGACEGYAN
jgi:hypothetical protein